MTYFFHVDLDSSQEPRPLEPGGEDTVMYRGWEISYYPEAAYWTHSGWIAYFGGVDLDAISLKADTFTALLDEIEDYE